MTVCQSGTAPTRSKTKNFSRQLQVTVNSLKKERKVGKAALIPPQRMSCKFRTDLMTGTWQSRIMKLWIQT